MARQLMRAEVHGLRELQRELRSIDRDLPRELRKANKAAADIVANRARTEAPVGKTGRLSKSVGVKAGQRSAAVKAGTAVRVPYAGPIHFGWKSRGIKPNPFLYRAITKTSVKWRATYERHIRALVKRAQTRR